MPRPLLHLEARRGEPLAQRQPAAPQVVVLAEELEPPPAIGEVLDDGVELGRLLGGAVRRLLAQHHVRVDIGVDDVPVVVAADGALDADEAVLRGRRDDRVGQEVRVAAGRAVRLDPRDVFTPAEAPFAQAGATPLQGDARAAPEEAERGRLGDGLDPQVHHLLRSPHLVFVALHERARGRLAAPVLLPRRVDQHDVKLRAQLREVEGSQVDLPARRRRRPLGDERVLEVDQLLELRVLLKALLDIRVANEVCWPQAGVDKVLSVVVLGPIKASAPPPTSTAAFAATATVGPWPRGGAVPLSRRRTAHVANDVRAECCSG
mmetsp:Transcript_14674/g.43643  ORF Transcript_14674/g.43643 Transcript_14674/m.43643 type:complete len:320 (-) Transcript_14674:37-996(-)